MRKFIGENRKHLLLLALLPVIIFPWAATGMSRFAGVDITKLHQPMRWFDVQSVRHGEFPLWNPNILSGMPQFAEGESGFLYIGNLPQYLPLDFPYAYTLVILLQFAISGIAAFTCLRHFKIGGSLAAAMAIVWAYSPFFMFHLVSPGILIVLALYPAFILLAGSMPGRPVRRMALIALLSSQIFLAGSIQMAFFGFISFFIHAALRWFFGRDKNHGAGKAIFWVPLAGVVLGGILSAVQIIPTLEMVTLTKRVNSLSEELRSIGSWLDLPRLVSLFIFPLVQDKSELLHYGSSILYLGLIPALFLMAALIGGWRNRFLKTHLITGALLVLLAMGTNNPFNFWMDYIPPFDRFRYYGRFAGFGSWHLLVVSTIWMKGFIEEHKYGDFSLGAAARLFKRPLIIMGILLAVYMIAKGVSVLLLPGIVLGIAQLIVILQIIRIEKWRKGIPWAAAILTLVVAYSTGNLFQLDTREYKRVLDVFGKLAEERPDGRFFLERESGLISLEGHGPLFLKPYSWKSGFAGGDAGSMEGLNILSGYSALKVAEWKDIIMEAAGSDAGSDTSQVYRVFPDYIVGSTQHEIPGYMPVPNENDGSIGEKGTNSFRSPEPVGDGFMIPRDDTLYDPKVNYGDVLGRKKIHNGYEITVECRPPVQFVIFDTYYPGWEARVDGEVVRIDKYDNLFKFVDLSSGKHIIQLTYRPSSFRLGMFISLGAFLVTLIMFVIPGRRGLRVVR